MSRELVSRELVSRELVSRSRYQVAGSGSRIRYRMRPIIRGWLSVFHSLLGMLIMTVV